MGFLYILLMNNGKYYVWSTRDIDVRMKFHISWKTKTTKWKEFKLVFSKEFDTYKEAYYRERRIKKLKSIKIIEKIVHWEWKWLMV